MIKSLLFHSVRTHSQHGQPAILTAKDIKIFYFLLNIEFSLEFIEIANTTPKLLAPPFHFLPK